MKENHSYTLFLLFEELSRTLAVPYFSIFNCITPQPYLIVDFQID